MNLKSALILVLALACNFALKAQKIIPLYPAKAPGSEHWNWKEAESKNNLFNTRVIYNVVEPTLTAYLPDPAIANGTAVVICPGGAFHILSMDSEGIDVAKWLNTKGVTAFVLKYRVVRSLTDNPVKELIPKMSDKKTLDLENDSVVTMAIADGKKAIEYVRSHATGYNINPKRIGLMGFSAGGTLTMGVGFSYTPENRPDFLAPIYPYMGALSKTIIPADAPPLFVCSAADDQLGISPQSVKLYADWQAAGKVAEIHVYSKGGHGFGMRKQNLPVDHWIERFGDWLDFLGLLKK